MTERLRRSNADLATFSHAMAHDLRNPLATISMWAAVARMRAGPGDDAGPVLQVVDQIKDVADYANELVTDLLQYAELDRGVSSVGARRPQPGRRPGDRDHRLEHRAAGCADRDRQPPDRPRPARRAPGRAPEPHRERHQVPRRSAAPDPPRRRPRRRRMEDELPGQRPGHPPDAREQVFEPFTRGHTSVPGSGLGLATCRRIVEGHGGRIWIASTGNLGTTVAFTLPAGPRAGARLGGGAADRAARGGRASRRRRGRLDRPPHAA